MSTAHGTILVVDDDPDLLRLMQLRLSAAGYAVTTAESAEQALAHFAVARPQLVGTDIRMGHMDGMALFDAIHAENPTLPVIVLTAHGTIPDAVAAVQRGVFGYLTKPFEAKTLLSEIEQALAVSGMSAVAGVPADAQSWRKAIITRTCPGLLTAFSHSGRRNPSPTPHPVPRWGGGNRLGRRDPRNPRPPDADEEAWHCTMQGPRVRSSWTTRGRSV